MARVVLEEGGTDAARPAPGAPAADPAVLPDALPEDLCHALPGLSEDTAGDGARILEALRRHGPLQADDLATATALEIDALRAALIGLELDGEIRCLPGARYEALA